MELSAYSRVGFGVSILLCVILQAHPVSTRVSGSYRSGYSARYTGGTRYTAYRPTAYRSTQYRAYRSSGYYGTSMRRYNYYSANSYYLSYTPTIRKTRSYTAALMGSMYWGYYSRYYYYASSAVYLERSSPGPKTTSSVCANYAEAENGTIMGIFICPLSFEPKKFKACCGDDYEEYCCEPSPPLSTAGIVCLTLFFIGIVIAVVFLCWYCHKNNSKVASQEQGHVLHRASQQPAGVVNNQQQPHNRWNGQNQAQIYPTTNPQVPPYNPGLNPPQYANFQPPGNFQPPPPVGFENVAYTTTSTMPAVLPPQYEPHGLTTGAPSVYPVQQIPSGTPNNTTYPGHTAGDAFHRTSVTKDTW